MRSGGPARLKHRIPSTDANTFRGRINRLMGYLKHNFPRQQIVLMTALHRGYATFGTKNIQPDETFGNLRGEFIDDGMLTQAEWLQKELGMTSTRYSSLPARMTTTAAYRVANGLR